MLRQTVAVALVAATVLAVGCEDDSGTNDVDEVDTTIVDDPNVPFDPDVPEGVDPGTNEVENQGFDPDDPGPEGNVSELPADD